MKIHPGLLITLSHCTYEENKGLGSDKIEIYETPITNVLMRKLTCIITFRSPQESSEVDLTIYITNT